MRSIMKCYSYAPVYNAIQLKRNKCIKSWSFDKSHIRTGLQCIFNNNCLYNILHSIWKKCPCTLSQKRKYKFSYENKWHFLRCRLQLRDLF